MNVSRMLADDPVSAVFVTIAAFVVLFAIVNMFRWIRYIPNTRVGVVEKLWSAEIKDASGKTVAFK